MHVFFRNRLRSPKRKGGKGQKKNSMWAIARGQCPPQSAEREPPWLPRDGYPGLDYAKRVARDVRCETFTNVRAANLLREALHVGPAPHWEVQKADTALNDWYRRHWARQQGRELAGHPHRSRRAARSAPVKHRHDVDDDMKPRPRGRDRTTQGARLRNLATRWRRVCQAHVVWPASFPVPTCGTIPKHCRGLAALRRLDGSGRSRSLGRQHGRVRTALQPSTCE